MLRIWYQSVFGTCYLVQFSNRENWYGASKSMSPHLSRMLLLQSEGLSLYPGLRLIQHMELASFHGAWYFLHPIFSHHLIIRLNTNLTLYVVVQLSQIAHFVFPLQSCFLKLCRNRTLNGRDMNLHWTIINDKNLYGEDDVLDNAYFFNTTKWCWSFQKFYLFTAYWSFSLL